jgi:hypothetical protein
LGEIVKVKVEKMVEVEVDDKALALQGRIDALPYSIFSINQAAGRSQRKEIFSYLKKNFSEHFDSKEPQKDIEPLLKKTEEVADDLERRYIRKCCDEENLPVFEFEINLNEGE